MIRKREQLSSLEKSFSALSEHLVCQYGLSLEFLTLQSRMISDPPKIGETQALPLYQPDNLLTSEQAATILGLRSKTLANWRVQGVEKLPFRRIGGAVRYKYSDLVSFIEIRKHENTSQY